MGYAPSFFNLTNLKFRINIQFHYKEKWNFYSNKENISSSKVSNGDEEVLFLGIERIENEEESEDKAEVNMKE